MKVAIIHDDLMRRGGAEKVALSILKAFPEADFYTLCYKPELTYEDFQHYKINTTWFQHIVFNEASMKLLFYPLGIWAMKGLKLKGYDLVIISTTFCAKYIRLKPNATLVTYCHTPFRLAWFPDTYKSLTSNVFIKHLMFKVICPRLRYIDKKYALRTNYFITNSEVSKRRIQDCYTKDIPMSIINPPVDLKKFRAHNTAEDYYLLVSRFQPYKKIDLVIEVFNQLSDKKLVIVGKGILEDELKALAKGNIEFKGSVDSNELMELYSGCKALIFPQVEDFGITPLEANASGRPVIAYEEGGVLETMIPYTTPDNPFTAFFFKEQTIECLKKAIFNFESIECHINSTFITANAARFGEDRFIKSIKQYIAQLEVGKLN